MQKEEVRIGFQHVLDTLEEQFPKGKNKERGKAVLLVALMRAFMSQEKRGLEEYIKDWIEIQKEAKESKKEEFHGHHDAEIRAYENVLSYLKDK